MTEGQDGRIHIRMCGKYLERSELATYRTHLSCDLCKLPKTRCHSTGELLLFDHFGDLNTVQCGRGGSERFEPAHVPDATLDKPMILLDQVV